MRDTYPKGLVTIKGGFQVEQHEQVIGVVKNTEAIEKKVHPLSQIMSMETRREGLVISTTDAHSPRRFGERWTTSITASWRCIKTRTKTSYE